VDIGMVLMLTDLTPSVVDVAPAVEERGFESLWIGEHTHCPVGTVHHYTRGRYGTGTVARDGYLPDLYKRMPDPYVTLAVAAAHTSTIRLGTCIALPAEHNPIILAKEIATLDQLTGGRFEFGVGYGWNPPEMRNNGCDPDRRHAVLREKILAMKALWTQETASFDGEFVSFSESWSYPKPFQSPHPPVLIGAAATARNVRDIVEWANGWIPVRAFAGEQLGDDIARVRSAAEAAGRDPDSIQMTVVDPEGSTAGKRSREAFLAHAPQPADLERYARLGIRRLNLGAPVQDIDILRWALDEIAAVHNLALG
jgi:probable F420-dependent oxidoreductase